MTCAVISPSLKFERGMKYGTIDYVCHSMLSVCLFVVVDASVL